MHAAEGPGMVDLFVLVMMHSILALAAWRLLLRPDLDTDPADDSAANSEPTHVA